MDGLLLLNGTNEDFANPAALYFTETLLSESIPDNGWHLPGFHLHQASRVEFASTIYDLRLVYRCHSAN